MNTGLLWVFLFLALMIGWFLGFASRQKVAQTRQNDTNSEQTKHRLQLLFDSYSDASLDQFINSLAVTPETLSLHISIGKHFRTEGEVDKAIMIHQNLMAHPEITESESEPVIYELAKDYNAAGLFDRAESLLQQLTASRDFGLRSRKLLLEIYEREREWEKALSVGLEIDLKKKSDLRLRVAHYYCEISEDKIAQRDIRMAYRCLKKALNVDRACIRAHLLLSQLEMEQEDYRKAIHYLKQVVEISPENTALVLPRMLQCTRATDSFDRHQEYLRQLYDETGQVCVLIALVESMEAEGRSDAALDFLEAHTLKSTGVASLHALLIRYKACDRPIAPRVVEVLPAILAKERAETPDYRCIRCGFSGRQLHWMCPSCKGWQSTQPIVEYEKASA